MAQKTELGAATGDGSFVMGQGVKRSLDLGSRVVSFFYYMSCRQIFPDYLLDMPSLATTREVYDYVHYAVGN